MLCIGMNTVHGMNAMHGAVSAAVASQSIKGQSVFRQLCGARAGGGGAALWSSWVEVQLCGAAGVGVGA
jgi:hypothetical protein